MKRLINATSSKSTDHITVDDVPDISDRLIDASVLFEWLDKLVEVKEYEESISDK